MHWLCKPTSYLFCKSPLLSDTLKALFFFTFFINRMVTEDGEAIGTAFAAETNRRDEDAEMYVV